jgi:hypothetical protein
MVVADPAQADVFLSYRHGAANRGAVLALKAALEVTSALSLISHETRFCYLPTSRGRLC